MAKWKLVLFESGVKAHYIPEALEKDIVDELYTRFMQVPMTSYDKDESWYDPGGMVMEGEELLTWTFTEGISIGTRVSHFEYLLEELMESPVREVNGKQYYKLHGWMHCIVLTPEQRNFLLSELQKNLAAYQEKNMLANLEFERRMANVNQDGLKILHEPRIDIPKNQN